MDYSLARVRTRPFPLEELHQDILLLIARRAGLHKVRALCRMTRRKVEEAWQKHRKKSPITRQEKMMLVKRWADTVEQSDTYPSIRLFRGLRDPIDVCYSHNTFCCFSIRGIPSQYGQHTINQTLVRRKRREVAAEQLMTIVGGVDDFSLNIARMVDLLLVGRRLTWKEAILLALLDLKREVRALGLDLKDLASGAVYAGVLPPFQINPLPHTRVYLFLYGKTSYIDYTGQRTIANLLSALFRELAFLYA